MSDHEYEKPEINFNVMNVAVSLAMARVFSEFAHECGDYANEQIRSYCRQSGVPGCGVRFGAAVEKITESTIDQTGAILVANEIAMKKAMALGEKMPVTADVYERAYTEAKKLMADEFTDKLFR